MPYMKALMPRGRRQANLDQAPLGPKPMHRRIDEKDATTPDFRVVYTALGSKLTV